MLQLRREIVRHFAAVRLVLAVDLVAEAAAGRIENHRDVVGVRLPQILVEHVAEGHDDFGLDATPRLKPFDFGTLRPSEIGTEDEPRTVDQKYVLRQRGRDGVLLGGNSGDDIIHARLLPARKIKRVTAEDAEGFAGVAESLNIMRPPRILSVLCGESVSLGCAGLARRRTFLRALLAGLMRRRHRDANP